MSNVYYTKTGVTLTVIQGGLSLLAATEPSNRHEVLVECTANGSRGVHTIIADTKEQAMSGIERMLSKAYKVVGVL